MNIKLFVLILNKYVWTILYLYLQIGLHGSCKNENAKATEEEEANTHTHTFIQTHGKWLTRQTRILIVIIFYYLEGGRAYLLVWKIVSCLETK